MSSSDTANHINVRRRISFYEAELIARSRELLARAEALLQQDVPTTFLGERRNPSPLDPIAARQPGMVGCVKHRDR
jgi:hypothetical protein